jgi:hypothetical protein
LDWIHKIVNAQTFPPVESVEVFEIQETTGNYYVISVPASAQAPHQSNDQKYYKRRGSHSEPMEHYEIEDVRNRPKRLSAPLRIELFTRDQLAFLYFKNEHTSDSVRSVKCRVDANFEFERDGIDSLNLRGLRELRPQAERYFLLDSVPIALGKNAEPELHVHVSYEFHEAIVHDTVSFFLADLTNSAVVKPPTVDALNDIAEKLDKLSAHLEKLRRDMERLGRIADASGLRLSQRTLRAFTNTSQLFDPSEFDWQGYKIVLDISDDEAMALHRIFGVMISFQDKRKRYGDLPAELRTKFERSFNVSFD